MAAGFRRIPDKAGAPEGRVLLNVAVSVALPLVEDEKATVPL
jgi:hypothetical protein